MVLATASSLPGIGEAETMTVSPGSMVMLRWSRLQSQGPFEGLHWSSLHRAPSWLASTCLNLILQILV